MRRISRAGIGLACVVLAVAAAACGDPSGEEVVDELVDQGLPRDQAECIVGELGGDAGRLFKADEDDLTEEDTELLMGAIFACVEA